MSKEKFLTDREVKELFGEFDYCQHSNGWQIEIDKHWLAENIKTIFIPQLKGIPTWGGFSSGNVLFHVQAHKQLRAAFAAIEEAGLVTEIIFWGGSYTPRLIRGSAFRVSRHSWGIAFDLNPAQNPLGVDPAPLLTKGSVLRLVPIMAEHGFAWGGHFTRKDGMHFEVSRPVGMY